MITALFHAANGLPLGNYLIFGGDLPGLRHGHSGRRRISLEPLSHLFILDA